MKPLEDKKIFSFVDRTGAPLETTTKAVRRAEAIHVDSYVDLAKKIAELQFRNPAYVLLFRGQCEDYKIDGQTSLRPSLFRNPYDRSVQGHNASIERKFRRLLEAEKLLLREYPIRAVDDELLFVQRVRIVRWAIIQHYDICQTPLLDLTHSLRIAASFGCSEDSLTKQKRAYLFVIAVPQLSGAVTVDVENGIQLVRLSAVCPPDAMRPHLQEGYLIGEYPDLSHYDQKKLYRIEEVDFGHRLLAKFCFNPQTFWPSTDFPKISSEALMQKPDPFLKIAGEIRKRARELVPPM